MKPFLKWAGGKRRQASMVADVVLGECRRQIDGVYYEPFLGGGAVLIELLRRRAIRRGGAVISDINAELINVWVQVRDNPAAVCAEARRWTSTAEVYYWLRDDVQATATPAGAARTLWLNRHCFNGVYRVNGKGGFNVPWGKGATIPLDEGNIHAVGRELERLDVVILVQSWERSVAVAGRGDGVYADPPYIPLKPSSFVSYSEDGFGMKEQVQLIDALEAAGGRGASWCLSNAGSDESFELYDDRNLTIDEVWDLRAVNSRGSDRGKVSELLVRASASDRARLGLVRLGLNRDGFGAVLVKDGGS